MRITVSKTEGNATPGVVSALNSIKAAGGGELHFEKGEYHFFREGTHKEFFGVSNNSACDKYIAFPIIGMENVTVDGHGSLFIFHEVTFPFMISESKCVTVKNAVFDTGMSPLVNFKLRDITEDGFYMDIDRNASPFYVENGALNLIRESGTWLGKNHLLSLHAIGRHHVHYLATGSKDADPTILPAPLMKCEVSETETGIYAKYKPDCPRKCTFGQETVSAIIDGGRSIDVICLDRSEEIRIENITVARGIGMGVIGQSSKNIVIDGFSTDNSYHGRGTQTLTADALHFVNCDGGLEIKNCKITDTMDDAINVHGIYTELKEILENGMTVRLMHREQHFFNPYRKGDRLTVIDPQSLEIVAEFKVSHACFKEGSGTEILVTGAFVYGKERAECGALIEDPDRMPDLYVHHNDFESFPHNRISGGGEIVVEHNRFARCHAALLTLDLARFWYESGRVKHLVYRNNEMNDCDITGRGAFIKIGIDGIPDAIAPRIHERIEIKDNRFSNIRNKAIIAGGVREIVTEGNVFDRDEAELTDIK